jgi:hypothetical protein
VHPGIRFAGSVTAGGFVSGSFGERRGRAAVDADGAIRAGDAATTASAGAGVTGRGRHLPGPRFPGVTAGPRIDVTAQRQAAGGNVSLLRDYPQPHLDEPLPARFGQYQHEYTRASADKIASFDGSS